MCLFIANIYGDIHTCIMILTQDLKMAHHRLGRVGQRKMHLWHNIEARVNIQRYQYLYTKRISNNRAVVAFSFSARHDWVAQINLIVPEREKKRVRITVVIRHEIASIDIKKNQFIPQFHKQMEEQLIPARIIINSLHVAHCCWHKLYRKQRKHSFAE
ncbi:hypothetical protein ACJX0J_017620 [Zea mays]